MLANHRRLLPRGRLFLEGASGTPEDATKVIAPQDHATLLAAQASGQIIQFATSGPVAVDSAAIALTTAQLIAYAARKRDAVAAGGFTLDVGSTDVPLKCQVDTSIADRASLNGMAITAQGNAAASFVWVQSTGNLSLSAAQVIALQAAQTAFTTAAWTEYSVVVASIDADTITTTAEIDAAGWPANS